MAKHSDKKMIQDIRGLCIDMIHEAKSGHPGIALGAAPMLYTLFTYHMNFDLGKNDWCNRDRFVMSSGHGSSLLYTMLFCTTEDYTLNDLKEFRSIYSKTPGHPEYNINNRIECSTGPLGQGVANAVGMAISSKMLASNYNKKKNILFDNYVYCLCGDGDLMEGVSYEAACLAGKYNLNNLIVLYDDNHTSLDGEVSEEEENYFLDTYASIGWEVVSVKNGESVKEINKALNYAKKVDAPCLIAVNTTIGKYSKYEGTNKIHGSLEEEDYQNIKSELGCSDSFSYDKVNMAMYRQFIKDRCDGLYRDWYVSYEKYMKESSDEEKNSLNFILNNESVSLRLDKVIDTSKLFVDKTLRDVNYQIMNVISAFVPNFVGGCADLSSSTKVYLKGKGDFSSSSYRGKNIAFGVREHAMGAILNGMALCNYRVFGSTYLSFSDYLKPAIRMSAMMNLPVTYIFTHDSILVGEDGPTHEPVEQLGSLRMIPNFTVYRPCDYKELIGSWNEILERAKPCALVLPRNHTETMEFTNPEGIKYGAYIISEVKKSLDVILIATGSEVEFAMKLKEELMKNYIEARVVSMPNMENFLKQDEDYRNEVLPKGYKKMVIEFSNDPSWYQLLDSSDDFIGVSKFGISGSPLDILKELELDISSLIIKIKNSI
jgi:transketolase